MPNWWRHPLAERFSGAGPRLGCISGRGHVTGVRAFSRKRGLHLFRARAETLRRSHHRSLRAALEEPHYPLLLQQFADWLDRRAWRENLTDPRRERLDRPVLKFATPLLEDDYRRVLKRGEDFARLTAEERHALRICIKELRYAMDFFASLLPGAVGQTLSGRLGQAAR